jgi:hypothetical protein
MSQARPSDDDLIAACRDGHDRPALDQLLERHWRGVRATIYAMVLNDADADDLAPACRRRLPGRSIYAVCALAAGLLVALGLAVAPRLWRGPVAPDSTVEIALFSASEIRNSDELFRRMEEVFPGDLRWIAETNGEVSLGLGQVSRAGPSGAAPLLVRTVVLERKRGEASWHRVFTADVLSRSEDLVEVSPGPKLAGRLLVWAYRLPDGNVAVDASLRWTDPLGLNVDLTNVLAPGRAAQVLATRTDDAEFRVLQAASPLSS